MTEPDGPTWMDDATAQRVREQVRAALAEDTVGATPVPADVAARLHARLSVETAAPTEGSVAPVTTLPVGARRPPPKGWYAAVAGLVAVAVGTTLVLTHHDRRTAASTTSAAAAAPTAPSTAKARELPTSRITHSDTVITTDAALDAHARDLVSGAGTADTAAGAATGSTDRSGAARLTIVGGLTPCLATLDDSKTPIAVDEVTYLGKDSLLVLFPGEHAEQVDAYIIGPACGAAGGDGIRGFRTVTVG